MRSVTSRVSMSSSSGAGRRISRRGSRGKERGRSESTSTPAQLETARRMQERDGLEFPLVEANAEDVPLADASFDLVVSEYGASLWATRTRWIPEAARLLRPDGRLVFLTNSTLAILCVPSGAGPGDRDASAPAARDVSRSPGTSRTASSSISATAAGSTSSAAQDSRSSVSSSCTRRTAQRRIRSTTPRRPTGRAGGRVKTCGWPGRPADPRLDVAAAAGDPRAARHPFEVVAARLRRGGSARRRRRRARASARQGRLAQSMSRGESPSESTRPSLLDGPRLRQGRRAGTRGADAPRAVGADAHRRLGRLPPRRRGRRRRRATTAPT